MGFIKWDRPRGSVHSVAKALALLGNEHCNVLLVSDATLYVIQNWVALDLEFKARWADEVFDHGYTPISEESANYSAWVDLIEGIQGEAIDMSCEIVTALESLNESLLSIKDSIDAMGTEQAAWDDLLTELLLPLAGIATGADVALLAAAFDSQQFQCCGELAERPYYPVPPESTQNPETSTFCQRASSLSLNWEESADEIFKIAKTATQIGLGLLSIVVAALSLPIAILVAILGLIVGGIAELAVETYYGYFDDLRDLIRCAIWNADTPQAAKEAVDQAIDDYESELTDIEKTLLKYLVSAEALNAVFDESYTIRSDAVSDCSDCAGEGLFRTAQTSPYNVIELGTDIIDEYANAADYGWFAVNPNYLPKFLWTAGVSATDWTWTVQVWPVHPPGQAVSFSAALDRWNGSSWTQDIQTWGPTSAPAGEWTTLNYTGTVDIVEGDDYRLRFGTNTYQNEIKCRAFNSEVT